MSTVYRLPEPPPVGTTVRPEPDNGERYTRGGSSWETPRSPSVTYFGVSWGAVLNACGGAAVVVEPDPHPTPWTVDYESDTYLEIRDANGEDVVSIGVGRHARATAERIVKAVNEATP